MPPRIQRVDVLVQFLDHVDFFGTDDPLVHNLLHDSAGTEQDPAP